MISDPIRKVNLFHQSSFTQRGINFKMNLFKTAFFKTTALTAALFAASPLVMANTAQVSANANANVQASPESGAMQSLGQNVKNAAHKTGESIERGADKTKAFTQEKWQDTKDFTADKVQSAKEKTAEIKQSSTENTAQAKQSLHEKSVQTKNVLSKKTDQDKTHNTGLKGNVQADLNTPAGKAHVSSETDAAIGIK